MKPTAPSFICASCARALRNNAQPAALRSFSSIAAFQLPRSGITTLEPPEQLPRWKQTPPAMKMPIRLRPQPRQSVWKVNDDEEKLNAAYDRFFGQIGGSKRGRELLDNEAKWLAITHKSHDHGRQGFNDRLAFLGKRIVDLQTSMALLLAPVPRASSLSSTTLSRKHRFEHEALEGVENVTSGAKMQVLDKSRLAQLAGSYGIDKVVRWKPKKSDNLLGSGVEVVMAHALYSIVGAVAMQQGGEMAARITRERILQPLGLR